MGGQVWDGLKGSVCCGREINQTVSSGSPCWIFRFYYQTLRSVPHLWKGCIHHIEVYWKCKQNCLISRPCCKLTCTLEGSWRSCKQQLVSHRVRLNTPSNPWLHIILLHPFGQPTKWTVTEERVCSKSSNKYWNRKEWKLIYSSKLTE